MTYRQVPLPGDVERLLMATAPAQTRSTYMAISVARSNDGVVTIRQVSLDPGSGRVVTRMLDQYQIPAGGEGLSDASSIEYWAGELVARQEDSHW